ncbi:hypothetical protein [Sphingobacterium alkalisoli]|uniref:hypothetical protein n=1 Tax=Sphingobacterium alkalisoli TaxID=1874115 RepID=UPI00145F2A96|nr:hypothetical protein [Sphingobacterium alkalisoli]
MLKPDTLPLMVVVAAPAGTVLDSTGRFWALPGTGCSTGCSTRAVRDSKSALR